MTIPAVGIKYVLMRKLLILGVFGLWLSHLQGEDAPDVPDFRPAKVEPTTQGAEAPSPTAQKVPDGMKEDYPVEKDENISLNKIYTYLNDADPKRNPPPPPDNQMMVYEPKYWDHGAILAKDRAARQGNIFVINWQNDGEPADFTVRLDYRQVMSRERVMTKTQDYKNFDGYEKTVLKVTGDDYLRGGKVHSWRISIVRDGKIVAEKKSFIW
ncbi:MAG: hypothetical protein ABR82_06970 [Verrucomicrobia subdivision 6 bacterium BACL9 MAG-120507-bin52]|uniref:Uncharacterized protein n=1 Tax=Verrucomicrobia subdivision 6 bacterium BACL9 MAG-120507-bin52 TaxID=1655590 RepID=A0A0R2RE71_9BACT|nr:MAG: hypothetical protein ABR82_06970 [Verrucomicrobia subdivision 6 bacterium BACL9 MAG-120507-bin52]